MKIKKKVSGQVMALPWVSGIGIAENKLAIYLARAASKAERERVQQIVDSEGKGVEIKFVQTGPFRKR